jgi:hypothetical protein
MLGETGSTLEAHDRLGAISLLGVEVGTVRAHAFGFGCSCGLPLLLQRLRLATTPLAAAIRRILDGLGGGNGLLPMLLLPPNMAGRLDMGIIVSSRK